MKKVLLVISFVILSIASYSQYHCYAVSMGSINSYTQRVTWNSDRAASLYIQCNDNTITIDNVQQSIFYLYGHGVHDYTSESEYTEWSAVDEEGLECKVTLQFFTNGNDCIMVRYKDIVVKYWISKI